MNLPSLSLEEDDQAPTPELFHSFEADGPFEYCSQCGVSLLDEGTHYVIEKGFHRDETTFEYALCLQCIQRLRTEISPASMKLLEHHFMERCDFVARRETLTETSKGWHEGWVDTCVLSNRPIDKSKPWQVLGQFHGDRILLTYLPYALSGDEADIASQRLSRQTRERLDQFIDDVLGVPGGTVNLPSLI